LKAFVDFKEDEEEEDEVGHEVTKPENIEDLLMF